MYFGLSFSPSSVAFALDQPSQRVTAIEARGDVTPAPATSPLAFGFSDPTVAGIASPTPGDTPGAFTAISVAHGTTTLSVTDGNGIQGSLDVTGASCGRSDDLSDTPVLVSPQSGATGVPTGVGKLYFGVYTTTATPETTNLHLIVGAHGTYEAGSLSPAPALPTGAATAHPARPNQTLTYLSVAVPAADRVDELHDAALRRQLPARGDRRRLLDVNAVARLRADDARDTLGGRFACFARR